MPWTVYAGCPIKPIKKRNKENIMKTLSQLNLMQEAELLAAE